MASRRKIPFLYLASQSPRRVRILKDMGIPFQVVPSSYREVHKNRLSPSVQVILHAAGKARKARLSRAHRRIPALILGADTMIFFRKKKLGKPSSYRQAEKWLEAMGGKAHEVYTGIVLLEPETGREWQGWEKTKVFLKRWPEEKIRSYLRKIDALDKAGGYAIQERPFIVSKIRGSRTNVIGLPSGLLKKLLTRAAETLRQETPAANQLLISDQKKKKIR